MPGSKRRALKQLLKAQNDASGSDSSATASPALKPNGVSDLGEDSPAVSTATETETEAPTSPSGSMKSPPPPEHAPSSPDSSSSKGLFGNGGGGGMYGGNLWGRPSGGGKKKSSKQRFAERQARKTQAILDSAPPTDPAWNAQLEKERQEELQVLSHACDVMDRDIFEIQPDGHCMFSAVADQLGQLGLLPDEQANNPYHTRRVTAKYMRDHKDDFIPFLAGVDGEDMPGATDDGIMTESQFEEYTHRVENTAEWGGEPEIEALSRAFNIPIHVVQRGPPTVVSHGGEGDSFGGATTPEDSVKAGEKVVRISYHRRMYGLGEHYNSLRKRNP